MYTGVYCHGCYLSSSTFFWDWISHWLFTSTDAKFLPGTLLFCLPSHQKSAGLQMCASVPGFTWVLQIQTQVLTELSPSTPHLINGRKMAKKSCNNLFWWKWGAVCNEHGKAQRPEWPSVTGNYYPAIYTLGQAPGMPSQSLPDPLYVLEVPLIHWASLSMSPLGICMPWRWSHSLVPICCLPCTQIHIRHTVSPHEIFLKMSLYWMKTLMTIGHSQST